MESRKRQEVCGLLAQLAAIHADMARIHLERKRLVEEVQGRRRHAGGSIMSLQKEKRRLITRRAAGSAGRETDEGKLKALAAALETEKATHVQRVEQYGAALQAAADARARLRKEAQALEKKRAELAHGLPRVYARGYTGLLSQGVMDPIIDVSGGACVCGCAIDAAQEMLPTSCESCDRLLIANGALGGEPNR